VRSGSRLRNHSDHAAYRIGFMHNVMAGDGDLAARNRNQRRHHADQRAFARAVRSKQSKDLTFRDGKAHILDGFETAIALDSVLHRDGWPRAVLRLVDGFGLGHHCFTSLLFGM